MLSTNLNILKVMHPNTHGPRPRRLPHKAMSRIPHHQPNITIPRKVDRSLHMLHAGSINNIKRIFPNRAWVISNIVARQARAICPDGPKRTNRVLKMPVLVRPAGGRGSTFCGVVGGAAVEGVVAGGCGRDGLDELAVHGIVEGVPGGFVGPVGGGGDGLAGLGGDLAFVEMLKGGLGEEEV